MKNRGSARYSARPQKVAQGVSSGISCQYLLVPSGSEGRTPLKQRAQFNSAGKMREEMAPSIERNDSLGE
jgi:hypothetical protein